MPTKCITINTKHIGSLTQYNQRPQSVFLSTPNTTLGTGYSVKDTSSNYTQTYLVLEQMRGGSIFPCPVYVTETSWWLKVGPVFTHDSPATDTVCQVQVWCLVRVKHLQVLGVVDSHEKSSSFNQPSCDLTASHGCMVTAWLLNVRRGEKAY